MHGFLSTLYQSYFALLVWQNGLELLRRIWNYVNQTVSIGNIHVSLSSLVTGILVLVLTVFLSRTASALLELRIAKRTHIDPGLRYTIARLVRYFLVIVGVLIALNLAFSVNLTSIAVAFTALSLGIGFGLQHIAADIAAGLILLFERPIRVGDRITIGEDEGDVQSINLRTTIVYTNDRISIIVPNSKLVSQRVINWSYGDPRARISVAIGVAIKSDIKLVTETLIEAAAGVENVLTDPPPKVQFLKFGEYSLDFRLLVSTARPNSHPQIKSDLNYRIEQLFRERGIEIPSPSHEFLIKGLGAMRTSNIGDLISEERAVEQGPTPRPLSTQRSDLRQN